jgi:hypothetical protein
VEVGRTPHIRLFDCFLADTTLRSVGGGMPGMGGMDMASLMSQMGGGAGGAGGAGGSKLPETEDLYLSHHQLTSPHSPLSSSAVDFEKLMAQMGQGAGGAGGDFGDDEDSDDGEADDKEDEVSTSVSRITNRPRH